MIRPAPRVTRNSPRQAPARRQIGGSGARPRITTPRKAGNRPGGAPRREAEILRAVLAYLKLCPGVVAWRQNSGMLRNPAGRPVRFGVAGISDIIGWVDHCRYPEVGNPIPCLERGMYHVPRFLAIECKRPGEQLTRGQAEFIGAVTRAGGLGLVATCVEDVQRALGRATP